MEKESKQKHPLLLAVFLTIMAGLCNAAMATFVKVAAEMQQSTEMIIFWRSFWALTLLIPVVALTQRELTLKRKIKTQRFGLMSVRALAGFISVFLFFYCLKNLSIAVSIVLLFTSALFMPFVSFLWKRYKIGPLSAIALAIGFLGVIFVVKPGNALFSFLTLLGLLSGFFAAISQFSAHLLGPTDPSRRISFYYFLIMGVIALIISLTTPEDWLNLSWFLIFAIFLPAGVLGLLYIVLVNLALKYGFPPLVAGFLYTSVIFSFFIDWILWGVIVDVLSILGIALIITGVVLKYYLQKREV